MTPAEFIKNGNPLRSPSGRLPIPTSSTSASCSSTRTRFRQTRPANGSLSRREPQKPGAAKALPTSGRRISSRGNTRKRSAILTPRWTSSSATPQHWKIHRFRSFAKRSEEHTSELQSLAYLVCRLLLEKKKKIQQSTINHTKNKKYTNIKE